MTRHIYEQIIYTHAIYSNSLVRYWICSAGSLSRSYIFRHKDENTSVVSRCALFVVLCAGDDLEERTFDGGTHCPITLRTYSFVLNARACLVVYLSMRARQTRRRLRICDDVGAHQPTGKNNLSKTFNWMRVHYCSSSNLARAVAVE